MSRDPLAATTRSAYGYVHGDPFNETDATGLSSCSSAVDIALHVFSCGARIFNGAGAHFVTNDPVTEAMDAAAAPPLLIAVPASDDPYLGACASLRIDAFASNMLSACLYGTMSSGVLITGTSGNGFRTPSAGGGVNLAVGFGGASQIAGPSCDIGGTAGMYSADFSFNRNGAMLSGGLSASWPPVVEGHGEKQTTSMIRAF